MDLTIQSLKIGDPLVMGRYGVTNDAPQPVIWLKASPNCDFITQNVLDYLCFDAQERESEDWHFIDSGNRCYKYSNLHSFLNSDVQQWYSPAHPTDSPPVFYRSHYGFLYGFEEYEAESLVCTSTIIEGEPLSARVRLPLFNEIFGESRFQLFRKKGVRPKPTPDFVQNRPRLGFDCASYVDFWIAGQGEPTGTAWHASIVSRSGFHEHRAPAQNSGVRPVCRINAETSVTLGENGLYCIKPYIPNSQNICTNEELLAFLGLA